MNLEPDVIVVEKLKDLNKNSKLKGRLSRNIRSSIGAWNWRYWLNKLEQACQLNRVKFRTVAPFYTSTTCPVCDHNDRANRNGEKFKCLLCGHEDNSDLNASLNILKRFVSGPYGVAYKLDDLVFQNVQV